MFVFRLPSDPSTHSGTDTFTQAFRNLASLKAPKAFLQPSISKTTLTTRSICRLDQDYCQTCLTIPCSMCSTLDRGQSCHRCPSNDRLPHEIVKSVSFSVPWPFQSPQEIWSQPGVQFRVQIQAIRTTLSTMNDGIYHIGCFCY